MGNGQWEGTCRSSSTDWDGNGIKMELTGKWNGFEDSAGRITGILNKMSNEIV